MLRAKYSIQNLFSIGTLYRMCSLQNVFSIECVPYRVGEMLYRMCSLQNVFSIDSTKWVLSICMLSIECVLCSSCSLQFVFSIDNAKQYSLQNLFSIECALCRMYSLQNVFSIECVLYRMCSLQNVFFIECVLYIEGEMLQMDILFSVFTQMGEKIEVFSSLYTIFVQEQERPLESKFSRSKAIIESTHLARSIKCARQSEPNREHMLTLEAFCTANREQILLRTSSIENTC